MVKNCFYILSICLIYSCSPKTGKNLTIDKNITAEAKSMYNYLAKISEDHTIFGHQHATEYGHGWSNEADRSDVKSVTGSHPGIIGIDFSDFTVENKDRSDRYKARVKKNVEDTYNRGGITTVAWHFYNPLSGGGFYWREGVSKPSLGLMIPGAPEHDRYKEILEGIADWAKSVKGADGKLVPMIFRPYHEFDGDWFWWGASHCTPEEFKSMWRFTVSYLRDTLGVHNFIYAFSPDNKFFTEEQYLARYPGDEWVDMLGMDNYAHLGRDVMDIETAIKKLKIVCDLAKQKNKLSAFTETGLESIPLTNWWTDILLNVIESEGLNLSYVLVWRNDQRSPTHYYAPYPGQVSVPDFLEFYNNEHTLFEKDMKDVYHQK